MNAISEITRLPLEHVSRLESLLQQNQLPADDCADQADHFYGLYVANELVAAGGLEPAGRFALLRSVVVGRQNRGQGLGALMTNFLIEQARDESYQAIYLLTETARDYFDDFGFVEIARDQVPAEIIATRQFSSLCPDSATCMRRNLLELGN